MRTLFRKLGQIGWSFPVITALLALCIASVFIIMSATYTNDALKDAPASQLKYLIIGSAIYLTIALTPYHLLLRISPILYLVGVVLLIAVFVPGLGKKVFGAYSWLRLGPISFEPAEFAKLAFILALAWFLRVREQQIHRLSTVLWALGFTLIPFLLIKKQPALGSAGVFIPIFFAMSFAAGVRLRHLLLVVLMGIVGLGGYFYISTKLKAKAADASDTTAVSGVHNFQVDRIKSWIDPTQDKQGAAWQINQSMIAIGSGGMDGKGWMQGTQNVLGYLPRNTSYNDLIFSVVGEEEGFRGGAALIICEGTVLLWCLWVAARARDKVGAMVAVGVMAMLFTHIFVNIGMTIQVVPITGIPLPFISYGGTFLVACLAAMGLVQSVWVHRKNFDRM